MASLRATKFKLLLLYVFCHYASEQKLGQETTRTVIAEALLYHQFQPSVSSPLLSRFSRQPSQNITAPNDNFQLEQSRNYQSAQKFNRQQQNQQQSQTSYLTPRESNEEFAEDSYGCPVECHCNKIAQVADCSNRNLSRVPASFPKDIRRIRLERNNITEIGPYAFQGLKRLQRIDLSNNNLYKIDALAFSGGLQTLNSLILYSNKLEYLPVNVFNELSQLQLLLLNANSLQTIHKDLFQALANLNLLSLYDNNIATLAAGTFDGLKSIKTIHLGKNPLNCDCNMRWLFDYFEANPVVETSEARCETPTRTQGRKLSQLNRNEFKCQEPQASKPIVQSQQPQSAGSDQSSSCPAGCICNGLTVDCSRAPSPQSESRSGSGTYELPDIPDDVPVYVARVHINDNRIKKIRQTGLFRRLANSQKLDLGNNKIVDIEDNAINGQFSNGQRPERVIFVLLENQHCEAPSAGGGGAATAAANDQKQPSQWKQSSNKPTNRQQIVYEDPCSMAPKVNDPQFDSACYNGGSCRPSNDSHYSNYSCVCPSGFAGPLCEINIDDCVDHQCQNGAMCVDGINSYKCICRDPTTTGEFCEQLNSASSSSSYAANSANSIAPLALPMIASGSVSFSAPSLSGAAASGPSYEVSTMSTTQQQQQQQQHQPQPILARSADFMRAPDEFSSDSLQTGPQQQMTPSVATGNFAPQQQQEGCHRITQRRYFDDGNGCQSVRVLKISECAGSCSQSVGGGALASAGCCLPAKVKRRRIRMQCSDGASYVKTIDLIKKCACTSDASCPAYDPVTSGPPLPPPAKSHRASSLLAANNNFNYVSQKQQPALNRQPNPFNVTQEDQLLQITRLDAVD